jgi:hypothetical protein
MTSKIKAPAKNVIATAFIVVEKISPSFPTIGNSADRTDRAVSMVVPFSWVDN